MISSRTNDQYTSVAKLLHWAIAALIVVQFVLANLAEQADEAGSQLQQLALLANHKSVGITVLALAIVRIFWRARNRPPALPARMPRWQLSASHVSHWTLYVLLFALPLSGWLMSSASAYSVSWFNLMQLPDFVAPDPGLKDSLEETHETLAKLLFVVAGLHILAAFKHEVIDKDGILRRMVSASGLAVFVTVIALGIGILASAGRSALQSPDPAQGNVRTTVDSGAAESRVASALPLWNIDYANSSIRFSGDQAGAGFDGVWQSWQADIRFSAHALDDGLFDVSIETRAVETEDDDRDGTLADPEWFDSTNFPRAYYRATVFSQDEDGSFSAAGALIIKGVATPTSLIFRVEADGDRRVLIGNATLDRLALGVGSGEWEDTAWVSQEVTVHVHVEANLDEN